ncbi:DEAD/DEAH box helicase family protein [Ornithinibacillus sp. FSL M8-0202]|uniref:TOTE conflict system archaeo-eukaryotic primase domain-containing protein n=1 Tax=Ornithinibacillus sp. FSL M8-0202 TaxID=2921616 RepID=UPI0030D48769
MTNLEKQIQSLHREINRLKQENEYMKQILQYHNIPINLPNKTLNSREIKIKYRIQIFRDLFKGRNDIYAFRWESSEGKSGYSPAINKSADTKSYLPLTNQVIYNHLIGKQTIGIYPLQEDNNCWFLAIDFDKGTWKKDAKVFLKACKKLNVPAYVEISRSGNGCHIWIFFQEPISAKLARKLGKTLLSMEKENHYETISSYDRMFPSQDELNAGGIGNLIALPLQGKSRKEGNSIFVDDNFLAYADQWDFLSNVIKVTKKEVELLIGGVHMSEQATKLVNNKEIKSPPSKITIIIRNGIYIPKVVLPTDIMNTLLTLASFRNPAYYKAQAQRLPTSKIPKFINGYEDKGDFIILPRGCLEGVKSIFEEYSISIELKDQSNNGEKIEIDFKGKLMNKQEEAANSLIKHNNGILSATTGFGKTVVAASIIAKRKVNTLVIVHRKQLMEQWKERLSVFLNLDNSSIGQIGGGKNKPSGIIDIATIQSLIRNGTVKDIVKDYGHIIVDECHHISAFNFERVLKEANATYVYGLTATPTRKDGLHPLMSMQCGPIRYKVSAKEQTKVLPFKHILIPRYTNYKMNEKELENNIQNLYRDLILNKERNKMIFNDVLQELGKGSTPIILTERREHVLVLHQMFNGFAKNIVILMGNMSKQEEESALKQLEEIPENQELLIIATGKYIGEGFDFSRLNTMFLTFPVSWKGTLHQYIGRLHRLNDNKNEVKVYDYVDQYSDMLMKMYEKRKKTYRTLGYVIGGDDSYLGGNQQMELF